MTCEAIAIILTDNTMYKKISIWKHYVGAKITAIFLTVYILFYIEMDIRYFFNFYKR